MEARLTQRRLLTGAAALVALVAVTSGCGGGTEAQAARRTDPKLVTYSNPLLSFSHPAGWKAYPFRWGVLQEPGALHDEHGKEGVLHLLRARSYAPPDPAALAEWDALLDGATSDCWLVGDPDSPCPPSVRARVRIRRSLLADQLDVVLHQHRRDSTATLPLPRPEDSVRLLRRPFQPISRAAVTHSVDGTHSLKRAPRFGNLPGWLAVGMMDGGTTIYHVPDAPQNSPGRPRRGGKRDHADSVIAAGLVQKSYGTVAMRDGALHFAAFPGPFFNTAVEAPIPEQDAFHVVPGVRHLAPAFHLYHRAGADVSERVFVLDRQGHLACWSRSGKASTNPDGPQFKVFAKNVIGAVQTTNGLLFAVGLPDRTDAYLLRANADAASHLYPIMHRGDRFLFGDLKSWRGGGSVYALRVADAEWLVGDRRGAERMSVPGEAVVLGCARPSAQAPAGLVVVAPGRMAIELHTDGTRTTLATSTEPIAQASFDAATGRMAWLGQKSGTLTVRAIGTTEPLLQTVPRGAYDAA